MQIDFSAAFYRVNHLGILYRLCSVGIGRSVLSIMTQFLSNRSQHVMVDGCWSKLLDVVSGVPQGCVLGPLLFLLYTSEVFSILENKLIGYADDSTLMAVVPSPGVRVTVAEFLIRDLAMVSGWCDLWRMKLNASKTKTVIVSRSRATHLQSPPLTIGGTVVKESDDLVILGVTFDSKLTFEKHLKDLVSLRVCMCVYMYVCMCVGGWVLSDLHDYPSLVEGESRGILLLAGEGGLFVIFRIFKSILFFVN